jgi:hypothetical protein
MRADLICPTSLDVSFFHEHGYWVTPSPIFTAAEIDTIASAAEVHQQGHRDRRLPIELPPYLDWRPEYGDDRLRMSDYIVHMNDQMRQSLLIPDIGLIAATLARTDQIRLHNSSFVQKPSESPDNEFRVGWHTDHAYWPTCSSLNMLTAWIPLHDATEENGTLTVLDGSNKWGGRDDVTALQRERGFVTKECIGFDERLRQLGLPYEPKVINVRKGHVSFHHCLTFHGSGRNRSPAPRKAAVLHLQDRENRFVERVLPDGTKATYKNDALVRRDERALPDYSDPEFCPVLWDDTCSTSARKHAS